MAKFSRVAQLSRRLRQLLNEEEADCDEGAIALIHAAAIVGYQGVNQSDRPVEALAEYHKAVSVASQHVELAVLPCNANLETMAMPSARVH